MASTRRAWDKSGSRWRPDRDSVPRVPSTAPSIPDVPPLWRKLWQLDPGEWRLISTDLRVAVPEGHVGLVCSRSGLALRRGLFVLNAPGVIDPGYRGEVGVILMNAANHRAVIRPGERVAQLLIIPTSDIRMSESYRASSKFDDGTDRGEGGFGSTGA